MVGVMIATGVIIVCIFLVLLIIIASNYFDDFNNLPNDVYLDPDISYRYSTVNMHFDKWRRLFEVNPTRFKFVITNGEVFTVEAIYLNHRKSHPIFQDETGKVYLIDFYFTSYIFYWFYRRKIWNKLNYLKEEQITESIIQDVQKKIDSLIEDSQRKVQESLEMQKKIVLQLNVNKEEQS